MKARNLAATAALFLCAQLLCPAALFAQSAPTPVDLDLTSTNANLSAGHLLHDHPVTINVGGQQIEVTSSSTLTPAERLAVWQVVSTQAQSIVIGQDGAATGGSMTLGAHASQYISGLNIPTNVTVLSNVANSQGLGLTGNLTNAGTMQFFSTDAASATANIAASNIVNSGLLTTTLPQAGIAGAISNLNLQLTALNNITNSGIISSAGNLSAIAGGAIINSLPANVTGIQPVMQAIGNMNLTSNIGSIINSGLISSIAGNVNINTLVPTNLNIIANGGRFEALAGSINILNLGLTQMANLNITGGDFSAQNLNLFAGAGDIHAVVNTINGDLNLSGHNVYAGASGASNLVLGNVAATGDPTFYSSGSIILRHDLVYSGQDLALLSSADIKVDGATIIDTSGQARGGNILMVAGTGFQPNPNDGNDHAPPDTTNPFTGSITLNGTSATGGSIDFSLLNAISSAGDNGGNVTLVAFAGTDPASGRVILNDATAIHTGGTTSSGNITVLAGATSGQAINIGIADTTGTAPIAGDITLLNATPQIVCNQCSAQTINILNGTVTSGKFETDLSKIDNTFMHPHGSIEAGELHSSGGQINIVGDNILVGTVSTMGNASQNSNMLPGINIFANHLNSSAATPFVIGPNATTNGVTGQLSAIAGNGDGGNLAINTASTGGIDVQDAGLINFNGTHNGSFIVLNATNGSIKLPATTWSLPGQSGGSGGTYNFSADKDIIFQGGDTTFNVDGAGSGAGAVNLFSDNGSIVFPGSLTVTAAEFGNNFGGSVSIGASDKLDISGGATTINASGKLGGGSVSLGGANETKLVNANVSANASESGFGGAILLSGSNLNLQGNTQLSANSAGGGNGDGGGGLIEIFADTLNASGSLTATANSSSGNSGGTVYLTATNQINAGKIAVQANGTSSAYGGSIFLTTPALVTNADTSTLSATGDGIGSFGGFIQANISSYSGPSALLINADGHNGADGGFIAIQNTDASSNISLGTGANSISVSATGGGAGAATGNGGQVQVDVGGNLTVEDGGQTVAALGDNGNGGNMELVAGYVGDTYDSDGSRMPNIGTSGTVSINAGTISADAKGSGNGGSVFLSGPIIQFASNTSTRISADGNGSGDGGTIRIHSGSDLDINSGITISASAQGINGNGGTIDLIAGKSNSGILTANGALIANAGGNQGDGGIINLSGTNAVNPIQLGGITSANGHGSGIPGEVFIRNLADADLTINLSGSISTTSESGCVVGCASTVLIPFDRNSNSVILHGSASSDLSKTDLIINDAANIFIEMKNTHSLIQIETAIAKTGNVEIHVPNLFSQIVLPNTTSTIQAPNGTVTIESSNMIVNGSISAGQGIRVYGNNPGVQITGTGSITINGTSQAQSQLKIDTGFFLLLGSDTSPSPSLIALNGSKINLTALHDIIVKHGTITSLGNSIISMSAGDNSTYSGPPDGGIQLFSTIVDSAGIISLHAQRTGSSSNPDIIVPEIVIDHASKVVARGLGEAMPTIQVTAASLENNGRITSTSLNSSIEITGIGPHGLTISGSGIIEVTAGGANTGIIMSSVNGDLTVGDSSLKVTAVPIPLQSDISGGYITLTASKNITIDATLQADSALDHSLVGPGGQINLQTLNQGTITINGPISATGNSGGSVFVNTKLDESGKNVLVSNTAGPVVTTSNGTMSVRFGSASAVGTVVIGGTSVTIGGAVDASSEAPVNQLSSLPVAGNILVVATTSDLEINATLTADGNSIRIPIANVTEYAGTGGTIQLSGSSVTISQPVSAKGLGGGNIAIYADNSITLKSGGNLTATAPIGGAGGTIIISAGINPTDTPPIITIDSTVDASSTPQIVDLKYVEIDFGTVSVAGPSITIQSGSQSTTRLIIGGTVKADARGVLSASPAHITIQGIETIELTGKLESVNGKFPILSIDVKPGQGVFDVPIGAYLIGPPGTVNIFNSSGITINANGFAGSIFADSCILSAANSGQVIANFGSLTYQTDPTNPIYPSEPFFITRLGGSAKTNFTVSVADVDFGNFSVGDIKTFDADGHVSLAAFGNIKAGGTITTDSLFLSTTIGSIGSALDPLKANTSHLTINAATGFEVYVHTNYDAKKPLTISSSSAGDTLNVINNGDITLKGMVNATGQFIETLSGSGGKLTVSKDPVGGNFISLLGDGGLVIEDDVISPNGSVSLITNTGILQIASGVTVSAGHGDIFVQNKDAITGSISIEANALLSARGQSNQQIKITLGPISPVLDTPTSAAINIHGTLSAQSIALQSTGNLNITGNIAADGLLTASASGLYVASESIITLGPQAQLIISGQSINTGSVIGGTVTSFYASNSLMINGNISVPNGTLFLAGKTIDGIAGISVNASRVRIVPQGDPLITLVGAGGSPGSGLNISSALLSNMSGGSVEIGQTNLLSGINVVGSIDLSAVHFGGLMLLSGGAYSGTGSVMSLGPASGLELQANSINTGSIIGGHSTSFYANNQLMVDGNVSVPNGTLLFVGKSIDASANISANAIRVRLIPSIDEPITLAGAGGSFGTGMNVTSAFLNNISAGSVEIGVTSLMSGINIVGNVDLSAAHFGVLILLNNGAYTATGSVLTLAPNSGLQVQAGTINTGSVLGGRQVEFFANNSVKIDGDLIGTPAISIGSSSITSDNVTINSSYMRLSAGAINLQPAQFNGGLVAISSTDFNFHTNSGALGVSAIVSTGSIVIRNDSGSVSIGATGSIQSLAGDILIESASLSLGHNSVTGNTVTLRPSIDVPIAVGSLAAGTGPFAISAADLGNITAQTVVIGGTMHGGGFNVLGNVNVSGSGPAGAFNLVFNNRDAYDGSAGTITLGNKTLTINVSALQLGPISSTGGGINIASASNIVINQAISIGTGALSLSTLPGSNGNIVLNANISAGSLLAITADGAGSIQGTGLLQAANISLASGTGDIGTSSANIQTACASLDAHTGGTGNVYVSQNGDIVINDSSAGSMFSVSANGSIKTAGVVTADSIILQSTSGGTVTIDPDITGTASILISVNGNGRIVQFPNTVIRTQSLILQAVSGDIGDALHPMLTEAQSMTIHTGGSATIYQNGNLSLGASSIGNSLQLQVAGNLAVDGAVTGTNLLFSTTSSSNGNITLNGNMAATAAIQIVAGGAGNVTQTAGIVISAPAMSISSSTGSLGSATADLLISAASLSLHTGGGGNVNARTLSDTTLLASSAGGDFTFSSGGSLLVAGDVLTNSGNLSLTADQGSLTVGGVHITANEGNLYLANTNSTSGSILIQSGAVLTARSVTSNDYGHVYLSVGELDDHAVRGRVPKNITINRTNGGQVYFGSAGITASGTNNVINLVHSTVVFDTGARPASAIVLGGNTTINATSVNGGEYAPVSFVEIAGCTSNDGLEAACLDSACVWTCEDVNVGLDSAGKLVLHSGEILIQAKKPVVIETDKCQIKLQKGAVALIKRNGVNMSAKFLHDDHDDSASIFHKGVKIAMLMPGQEFICSENNDKAVDFLSKDAVARRKVNVEVAPPGLSILTSEFSIMAAISESKPLKGLMMVSRKEEHRIAETILRTAACLSIVNASHGPFSRK